MNSLIINDLKTLCTACGCANQPSIATVAVDLLRPLVDEIHIDSLGNIIGIRHAEDTNAKTILLEAHMDEIGFLVTHIDDNGFVHVAAVGGVDARIMAAQPVIIFGDKPYHGVVCSVPPHISGKNKTLPAVEELGIDVGMTPADAQKHIPLGARVTFAPNFVQLNNRLICSKSLDNRSGMAAILHCLRQTTQQRNVAVKVAFCVQEELGCRGAAIVASQTAPSVALVTDVSFAAAYGENRTQCGILGDGVMIGISPILHDSTTKQLFSLAQQHHIPYQTEVMASSTGTDADQISICGEGVPSALLSIPLRYMHTPNEIVDSNDILAVANLMTQYIKGEKNT